MAEYGKAKFVTNMLIMTGTMLVIRVMSMAFNIYFTSVIGASGAGMYHVIFSVYGFMVTFSVAGTSLAVTRLVSETGAESGAVCNAIVKKCISICVLLSLVASGVVWVFGESLGKSLFDAEYASTPLCLLCVSLPAVAVSAVLRGYFIAARKVGTATTTQLAEEISCIATTVYILHFLKGSPYAYMSMIAGITFSSIIAAVLDIVMYRISISATLGAKSVPPPRYKDIFAISIPVALGSYLRSALMSAENILIPKRLAAAGVANALGEYGIIKGMSMPLMLFPTVFIVSLANMLVPELAERRVKLQPNGIRYIASKAISLTLYFAFMAAGVFVVCHDVLGEMFYKNAKVGTYLGLLSLLVIPMYLDTVVDSMLKGLGEQVSSLKYNIIDSTMRVSFIWLFIPYLGAGGYIFLLYASEVFNLRLSLSRLIKVTGLKLTPNIIVPPAVISLCAYIFATRFQNSPIKKAVLFLAVYVIATLTHLCVASLKEQKAKKCLSGYGKSK